MTNFTNVLEFHRSNKLPIGETASIDFLDFDRVTLRDGFIIEEFIELMEAQGFSPAATKIIQDAWDAAKVLSRPGKADIVGIADALADIDYFNNGTAIEYGIDLDEVHEEVHASNMSKLGADGKPIINDGIIDPKQPVGKVLKGPNYFKPDIKHVLEHQFDLDIG